MCSKSKKVVISIVSHSQTELVDVLLNDLARQDLPADFLVIVRHNVKAEPCDIPANLNVLEVCNEAPLGFGANHNLNSRIANSAVFVILNPDIRILADGLVKALVSACMREFVMLAPRILGDDGREEQNLRPALTPMQLAVKNLLFWVGFQQNQSRWFWIAGMFIVVRTDHFRRLNGFDEKFFMYVEDADLCLRSALVGERPVRLMSHAVVHNARRDSRKLGRLMISHLWSLILFFVSKSFFKGLLLPYISINSINVHRSN